MSSSSICIQRARRADFATIAQLQAASCADAYRDELPARYLAGALQSDLLDQWASCKIKQNDLVLTAHHRSSQALVGFASVWCRPTPFLDSLHCHPDYRSLGFGSALLREVLAQLHRAGHASLSLTVLSSNDAAKRFYLRHGGQVVCKRRDNLFGFPVDVDLLTWPSLTALSTRSGPR